MKMEEKKGLNWGVIVGIIVATVAVLAAGAYLALKLLKKKECCCEDGELEECDICVLDECEECAEAEEADAE